MQTPATALNTIYDIIYVSDCTLQLWELRQPELVFLYQESHNILTQKGCSVLCLLQATFLNLRNQTYKYNEKKVNLSSLALLMSFLLEAMSFSIIPPPPPSRHRSLKHRFWRYIVTILFSTVKSGWFSKSENGLLNLERRKAVKATTDKLHRWHI